MNSMWSEEGSRESNNEANHTSNLVAFNLVSGKGKNVW